MIMEKDIPLLLTRLKDKYGEINLISDWKALQAAGDLDQINAIIERREALLREILEIETALTEAGAPGNPAYKTEYNEIQAQIREIQESDKGIMNKIARRMEEIKEELKAKTLFRMRALPGYIKQKYAFSK
jgi:hypothetical protein